MDWRENINTLKEIFPGHFQVVLDFATIDFVKFALSDKYKFVWVSSHELTGSLEWKDYNLPLVDNKTNHNVRARKIEFDFVMPTDEFIKVLPSLGPGITMTQLNVLPSYYLDPKKITGKTRYDLLLRECDYLFEIYFPSATDYGTLVSSDKNY